ncbi:hypothetical protein OAS86_05865 [Gammaproteobacteria bacterium]|nr:hypothetical protein [Gammaproteobacteria bacterium]
MNKIKIIIDTKPGTIWYYALIPLIVALLGLGYHNAFIQDDAFISFRYASNLVSGDGLTWNPQEHSPIEGYTNFLWVLIVAAAMWFDFEPVTASQVLGLVFGAITLTATAWLANQITKSERATLLTVFVLGTNYTFSCYMTGGLETALLTSLITLSAIAAVHIMNQDIEEANAWHFIWSITAAAALMTRLDSAILLAPSGFFFLARISTAKKIVKIRRSAAINLCLPFLALISSWALFKLFYYGNILPNTYYAKATDPSVERVSQGILYAAMFFFAYFLIVVPAYALTQWKRLICSSLTCICFLTVSLWLAYVVFVGGDFMEFRMFVPIMPMLAIGFTSFVIRIKQNHIRATIIICTVLASAHHAWSFEKANGVESISSLTAHVSRPVKPDWIDVGKGLGAFFENYEKRPIIAVTAAGAIPFYSMLETVDMLGLNDHTIARQGQKIGVRPGHTVFAKPKHLISQNVDLIIGHPRVVRLNQQMTSKSSDFFPYRIENDSFPARSRIIRIPLNDGFGIDILYIGSNRELDTAVENGSLQTVSAN